MGIDLGTILEKIVVTLTLAETQPKMLSSCSKGQKFISDDIGHDGYKTTKFFADYLP
jgi:hypothetical protein